MERCLERESKMKRKLVYEKLTDPKNALKRLGHGYIGDRVFDFEKLECSVLNGPKGIGKTLMAYHYARKNGYKLLICECSEEIGYPQLVGHYGLSGEQAYFSLGYLPTAVKYSNKDEKFILLLEELNALPPASQKMLNALLDLKSGVTVKEIGRRYELKGSRSLVVIATMNLSFYGGVFELNEDLKSRFHVLAMGYPGEGAEKKILAKYKVKGDVAQDMINLAMQTRTEAFKYALSTRDLCSWAKLLGSGFGMEAALQILKGKFEDDDYRTFRERAKGVFGVSL